MTSTAISHFKFSSSYYYAMSGSVAFSSPNPFASSSRPPRNLDEPLCFTKDYRLLTHWVRRSIFFSRFELVLKFSLTNVFS